MTNNNAQIAGYYVHYLKGSPSLEEIKSIKTSTPVAFPLELVSKIIRPELKESFLEFLDKINHRVPLESEFNEWYSKHLL